MNGLIVPNGSLIACRIGGQDSLIKKTEAGLVQSIRQKVLLKASDGHFYRMGIPDPDHNPPPGKKKNWINKNVITAKGFDFINSFAGITFTTPETQVSAEGVVVGNPYYVPAANGTFSAIRITMIGWGRTQAGNWAATSITLTYNFMAYLAADLYKKYQEACKDGKECKWGHLESSVATSDLGNTKIRVPVTPMVSLVVDVTAPATFSIWKDHSERQKFCDRNAESMVRRNILKKMLGISWTDDNDCVEITVWPQAEVGLDTLSKMQSDIKRSGKTVIDGTEIVVDAQVVEADLDEVELVAEEDEEAAKEEVEVVVLDRSKVQADIRDYCRKNKDWRSKVGLDRHLNEMGFKDLKEAGENGTAEQLSKVLKFLTAGESNA